MQGCTNSTNSAHPGEESYSPVLHWVIVVIPLFLGVVGNSAVIIYNIFLNRDKTPSSWLVTHLAFADLLVCLAISLAKSLIFHNEQGMKKDIDDCLAFHFVFFASTFLSIMILLTITIDKYLYIAKPLRYPMIVTKRRIFILVSCIWVAALVQPAIIYIINYIREGNWEEECHIRVRVITYLQIVYTLVPIGITAILNYKMFKIVKEQRERIALEVVLQQSPHEQSEQVQSERNQTRLRRLAIELKVVKTFAIIVGFLIFCFVPYITIGVAKLVDDFDKTDWRYIMHKISKQLVAINSIVNAYIYALRHKRYRKAYKQLLVSVWARLFHTSND